MSMNVSNILKCVFIVCGVLILAACGGNNSVTPPSQGVPDNPSQPTPPTTPTTSQLAYTELQPGDCFTSLNQDDVFIDMVEKTDCINAHSSEVAGIVILEQVTGDYLGFVYIVNAAYKQCAEYVASEHNIDIYAGNVDIETIVPSSTQWRSGDREVICLFVADDGAQLTEKIG